MSNFHWLGYVWELETLLERIFVLETNDCILANRSFQGATSEFQIRIIQNTLAQRNCKLSNAADALGLSRHTLHHQDE